MPNSRFALHGERPSLIHGLCAFFASNSRFMRLFQAALDTPLNSPFSATLSVHGLHFTVCAPSNLGAHIHDPNTRTSMTQGGAKKTSGRNFGLIFGSLWANQATLHRGKDPQYQEKKGLGVQKAPPKGPFRAKNATALESVAFCYRRSFLLLVRFLPLFLRKTSMSEHSPYCFANA